MSFLSKACGGMAMCASCHCYIDSDHLLNEPSDDEEDMLDQAFFVENNSRLGCQIFMSSHLEGLQVTLAQNLTNTLHQCDHS